MKKPLWISKKKKKKKKKNQMSLEVGSFTVTEIYFIQDIVKEVEP